MLRLRLPFVLFLVLFFSTQVQSDGFNYAKEKLFGHHSQDHFRKDIIDRSIDQINLTAPYVNEESDLIILVPILPQDFNRRAQIRATWAARENSITALVKKFSLIFLVAQESISNITIEELETHNDILVVYGFETYRRLVYKLYYGYLWVKSYYPYMTVAKVDSDVVVNLDNLYKTAMIEKDQMSIIGRFIENRSVVRDQFSKWYVDSYFYPEVNPDIYPQFVCGLTYIVKPKALAAIVNATAHSYTALEVEDAYFTGVIANSCGVKMIHNNNINFEKPDPCSNNWISYEDAGAKTPGLTY